MYLRVTPLGSKTTGVLVHYPGLIYLDSTNTPPGFWGFVSSSGTNILIYDESNVLLNRDIIVCDVSGKLLIVRVDLPVYYNYDSPLKLVFGSASASQPATYFSDLINAPLCESSGEYVNQVSPGTYNASDLGTPARAQTGRIYRGILCNGTNGIYFGDVTQLNSAVVFEFSCQISIASLLVGNCILVSKYKDDVNYLKLYTNYSSSVLSMNCDIFGGITAGTAGNFTAGFPMLGLYTIGDMFKFSCIFDGTQIDSSPSVRNSKRIRFFINDMEVVSSITYSGNAPESLPNLLGYPLVVSDNSFN